MRDYDLEDLMLEECILVTEVCLAVRLEQSIRV
jgi:hypothetical protein